MKRAILCFSMMVLSSLSFAEVMFNQSITGALIEPESIDSNWNNYQIQLKNIGNDPIEMHRSEFSFSTPTGLYSAPWGATGMETQLKSVVAQGNLSENTLLFNAYNNTSFNLQPEAEITITFGYGGRLDIDSVEATFKFQGEGVISGGGGTGPDNQPEIELLSPPDNAITLAGESILISADTLDRDGDLAAVNFYVNNTLVATRENRPYEARVTIEEGSTEIYAEASDEQGNIVRTDSVTITAAPLSIGDVSGSGCNFPQYQHNGDYIAGDKVQNNGSIYVCKQFGWCGQAAYEPGVDWYGNDYWINAWTLEGACDGGINIPPVITVSASEAVVDTPFGFMASAGDEDGTITSVAYYLDGLLQGEATTAPFTFNHPGLDEGEYRFFGVATDDKGAQTRSATETLTVSSAFEGNRLTIVFPQFDHKDLLNPPPELQAEPLTGELYCPADGSSTPISATWGETVHIDGLKECSYQLTLDSVAGYLPRFSPWLFDYVAEESREIEFNALYRAPLAVDELLPLGGIEVSVYKDGVYQARQMVMGNNVIYVGSTPIPLDTDPLMGMVYAIELDPQTQEPIGTYVVAQGEEAHGVAYRNGTLYYSTVGAIYKIENIDETYKNRPQAQKIFTYPADGEKTPIPFSQFWTRYQHQKHPLRFNPLDPSDERLYTAVGLPCNICITPLEELYGTIFAIDLNTGSYEILASGIRNAVSFDWHPVSGEIWFSDHNRQQFPNPDEINRMVDQNNRNYGAPIFFGKDTRGLTDCEMKNWQYMLLGKDMPVVECDRQSWEQTLSNSLVIPPLATLPQIDYEVVKPTDYVGAAFDVFSNSAPLGVIFWKAYSSADNIQHLIYATHGNSRPEHPGLELRMLTIENGTEVIHERPLVTGWMKDLASVQSYGCLTDACIGRPVEFLELNDGSLLVSDDKAGVIYRLAFNPNVVSENKVTFTTTAAPDPAVGEEWVSGTLTYPNGHKSRFHVKWGAMDLVIDNLTAGTYSVELNDVGDYIPEKRNHDFVISGTQKAVTIALNYIEKPKDLKGIARFTAPAKPAGVTGNELSVTFIDKTSGTSVIRDVAWGQSIQEEIGYGQHDIHYSYFPGFYPSPSKQSLLINESQLEHSLSVAYISYSSGGDLIDTNCTSCHSADFFDDPNKANIWSSAGIEALIAKILSMPIAGQCDEVCAREIAEYLLDDVWIDYIEAKGDSYGVRQIRLLTSLEYANSVRDILGVTVNKEKLPRDKYNREFKFAGQAGIGVILPEDMKKYYEMAVEVSGATDLAGLGYSDSVNKSQFVSDLGLKVFRRPLSDEEQTRFTAFLNQHGPQDLIASMLLSPNFLYRHELGERFGGEEAYKLTQYETAAALSYTFLGTTPSRTLLAKAERGELESEEQIIAEVVSMVRSSRGVERFTDFIGYYAHTKVQELPDKPGLSDEVVNAMVREQSEAIRYLLTEGEGSVTELFNPGFTFVNGTLSQHYGIGGVSGDEFQKVEVANGQRGGLLQQGLTQVVNSDYVATSLVKRGLMIRQHLLCRTIGAPVDVDPDDVTMPSEPITTRERWDIVNGEFASAGQCWHCHLYMNDTGASMENYDANGQWRVNEAAYNDPSVTLPIDASGPLVDNTGFDVWLHFKDVRDVSAYLPGNLTVLQCLADSYFRYATGQEADVESASAVSDMTKALEKSGSIQDMFQVLATSQMFKLKKESH